MSFREARINAGLKGKDVAAHFGVHPAAVTKWEKGKNLPKSPRLIEVAKLYGCTVDELLKGNGDA